MCACISIARWIASETPWNFCSAPQETRHSAKRFFSRSLAASHISTPRVITVDKNAAYPKAFKELKAEGIIPDPCELRQRSTSTTSSSKITASSNGWSS
jgi:transposase-like protein